MSGRVGPRVRRPGPEDRVDLRRRGAREVPLAFRQVGEWANVRVENGEVVPGREDQWTGRCSCSTTAATLEQSRGCREHPRPGRPPVVQTKSQCSRATAPVLDRAGVHAYSSCTATNRAVLSPYRSAIAWR